MDCDGFVVTNGLAVSPFNGFMLQKKIFDLFNDFAVYQARGVNGGG